MGLSLGRILVDLLNANSKDPSIVSCTLSPAATEEIVADFTSAVSPKIGAYHRESRLTPSELQQLTFG